MTKINGLKKYLDYEFSSDVYAGEDYLTFQTKYLNYLRSMCRMQGWKLINFLGGHYCFSTFIKSEGKFVLIRTAKNERDYYGDWNNYTTLPELQPAIVRLFKEDKE
jgi:hypothetical protein